jgi:hypothetical protein
VVRFLVACLAFFLLLQLFSLDDSDNTKEVDPRRPATVGVRSAIGSPTIKPTPAPPAAASSNAAAAAATASAPPALTLDNSAVPVPMPEG